MQVPDVSLECLVYSFPRHILIAVIYRPPSYPMSSFKEHLGKLLDHIVSLSNTVAVMGDFNDNILTSSTICTFMTKEGFVQLVTQPTTDKGTLIDHVYVKTAHYDVETVVLPTYFSDYKGTVCSFYCISFQTDKIDGQDD